MGNEYTVPDFPGAPQVGVPMMSAGAYYGGWADSAEANIGSASWGPSSGGGTNISYGSVFGGGSYSSTAGWSYDGYSGGSYSGAGSLGNGFSTSISLTGMDVYPYTNSYSSGLSSPTFGWSGYASPALIGFGDGVSGGYTITLRQLLGTDSYVNKDLATYKYAQNVGTAWQIGLPTKFGAVNTLASISANVYEGNKNNVVVDAITYGTSRVMSGGSKRVGMQVFGNAWGYTFGQTALSTAPDKG